MIADTYACFEEGDSESRENVDKLDKNDLIEIERAIESELGLSSGSVMFDIPDRPRLFGTSQAVVQVTANKMLLLQDIYPAGAWAKAYVGYRRVAYIFTTEADREKVGSTARGILARRKYPIVLNENSLLLAKP